MKVISSHFNPLSAQDALKHNFTSLKTSLLHPLQVENCDSNSRLVVDEDDNGEFRLERVKSAVAQLQVAEIKNLITWSFRELN